MRLISSSRRDAPHGTLFLQRQPENKSSTSGGRDEGGGNNHPVRGEWHCSAETQRRRPSSLPLAAVVHSLPAPYLRYACVAAAVAFGGAAGASSSEVRSCLSLVLLFPSLSVLHHKRRTRTSAAVNFQPLLSFPFLNKCSLVSATTKVVHAATWSEPVVRSWS
ncbi:hypothetical protein BKA80DRAFT_66044 [Phyllosticta citrichinensis]